jgi:phosphatidylinositol 4-kinase
VVLSMQAARALLTSNPMGVNMQVMMHTGGDQMLIMVRLIQGSVHKPSSLSSHPAAAGTLFTLLLLGLKVCQCLLKASAHTEHTGVQLLQDSVYRYIQLM